MNKSVNSGVERIESTVGFKFTFIPKIDTSSVLLPSPGQNDP